ncbi:3-hydroxyacyl-CoA dehydrogenase [Oceanobacter mangrovi]|uniref:3-hydroxyacyl-CoA dehydrogenase n=1 Tax=Oceanobacter mangrovi TaxID=2862510 RepID=UPI001C8E5AC4|nr:3-hydroxyacyl-CoA dehydrogenase [Oceanobacter mangrovi]
MTELASSGSLVTDAASLRHADSWQQQSIAELPRQVSAADQAAFAAITRVAVVGAGAMGRCIAIAMARLGKQVLVIDASESSLAAAQDFISGYIAGQQNKRKLTDEQAAGLASRFSYAGVMDGVAEAGLVVEAVPEILELKQSVMQQLEALVSPDCILATNTSTLDLDAIANAVEHSERVIGTHFFIPAHITRLLEIVPAQVTSAAVLGLTKAMALALGKVFVVAGNCDGFIGNRLFDRFHQEAMYLLEEGATPEQIDTALEGWGMAIGPLRALDMVGNDIPWGVRVQRAQKNPDIIQPSIGDALCEQGRYGQKTGSGWYHYEPGSRTPVPSAETAQLLEQISTELGLNRRQISKDEIIGRCILALVNEGCAIVREGFAQAPVDIDLAFVNGYGFPASAGGPMFLAQQLGLNQVAGEMRGYQRYASHGKSLWQPDDLLVKQGQRGGSLLARVAFMNEA